MRFLVHGAVHPDAVAAMVKHEQACHAMMELSGELEGSGVGSEGENDPAVLLPILEKKQWNLLTVDTDFVRDLYEKKVEFGGVVVLILDDPAVLHDQDKAIERLFERYKRLTVRRMYTVTPSRVKIRQLPGAGQV